MSESNEDAALPTRRLRSLIQQLIDELGGRYGAKSQVARTLGLGQAYVSKIHHGQRSNVTRQTLSKVAEAFELDLDYFFAPGPDELSYRAYLQNGSGGLPPGWEDWLAKDGAQLNLSPDEREALRRMGAAAASAGFRPIAAAYSAWLTTLRMTQLGAAG